MHGASLTGTDVVAGEGAAESGKNEKVITLVQVVVFPGALLLGGFLHDNPTAVVVPECVPIGNQTEVRFTLA